MTVYHDRDIVIRNGLLLIGQDRAIRISAIQEVSREFSQDGLTLLTIRIDRVTHVLHFRQLSNVYERIIVAMA
jgi:hypothetical protein